ncbi:lytic transglycosylase domain-containing protein [Oceaniglobus trochenteri]|uniref:lytic transglycosylase domain-containing protein n=1 Tax=Oceaniglobus trochenteri TaxID=2763260 RepID=UPI001CFF6C5A|nr:lytic transglycosylase domain-containing protein [Oceaniglobus trochenteri]
MRPILFALLIALAACSGRGPDPDVQRTQARGPAALNRMIARYADRYDVPVDLVHRVVQRESGYNPAARNGPYYGLMQIHPTTARTMGHRGPPSALLDAETNLEYAVKYLRGAWMVSDGSRDAAVGWYSRGYYYEAKRRGLLYETGLRR